MLKSLAPVAEWLRRQPWLHSPEIVDARTLLQSEARAPVPYFRGGSKPYTRWWWLAGPFRPDDIRSQLAWLHANGFGGVELAWLWPSWMGDAEPGIEWLGAEWSSLVACTKQEADRLGLGCDFTFGSCWPFGGSAVQRADSSRTRLAVYLPTEDNRRLDRIPSAERTPAAVHRWEMRHVVVPREIEGYAPLWVSSAFLGRAEVHNGGLCIGDCRFSGLLVDVDWLDGDALAEIVRLAEAGLRVILGRVARAPGKHPRRDYQTLLDRLQACENVCSRLDQAGLPPLVEGRDIPPFWARRTPESLYLFFGHPMTREVRYPMRYGQSHCRERMTRRITIRCEQESFAIKLVFEPYQSIMIQVSRSDRVQFLDLGYRPPDPRTSV
jgi:hypothetical protein